MAQVLLAHMKGIGKAEACPTGAERSVANVSKRGGAVRPLVGECAGRRPEQVVP